MRDRSEILGICLFVVPAAVAIIGRNFFGIAVTPDLLTDLILVITVPIYGYAVYWALDTRKALAVRVYRSQALGTGLLALMVWLSYTSIFELSGSPNEQLSQGVTVFAFVALLLALFYFADITVRASRRSDPLLRDTLQWSKVRIPLWLAIAVSFCIILAVVAYGTITNNLAILNDISTGDFGNAAFNIDFNYLIYLPFVGVIPLAVVWFRAKWDRILRRHFLWLIVALVMLFATTFITVGFIVVFLAAGYFLYRASRSLAPVSRLTRDEKAELITQ